MTYPFVLTLKPEIAIAHDSDQGTVLQTPTTQMDLSHLSASLLESLERLANGGATEAELSDRVLQIGGFNELPKFHFFLSKFVRLGTICYSLHEPTDDGPSPKPFASLIPMAKGVPFQLAPFPEIDLSQGYELGRFAFSRRAESSQTASNSTEPNPTESSAASQPGYLVLESPESPVKIELRHWRAGAIVAALAAGKTGQELLDEIPGVAAETVEGFLSLLLGGGMIVASGTEQSDALRQWEFHDLLFQTRSRQGRTAQVVGSTYRFRGEIDPRPVLKPQPETWEKITLDVPDLEAIAQGDRPFTEVLESRHSIRTYNAEAPLTLAQLSEFLYRSARVRQRFSMEKMNCSDRPYPGGGACYEFELYIVANRCDGLEQGLYHYCPQEHQLGKVQPWDSRLAQMMGDASHATRKGEELPQVLIVVASRFQRVAWKYESIAYALILKNLGCLYQTMYLVATSMGLAPCGLGCGNADLFSELIGSEYYAETSVGEFTLGSLPSNLADEPKLVMMEQPVDWQV